MFILFMKSTLHLIFSLVVFKISLHKMMRTYVLGIDMENKYRYGHNMQKPPFSYCFLELPLLLILHTGGIGKRIAQRIGIKITRFSVFNTWENFPVSVAPTVFKSLSSKRNAKYGKSVLLWTQKQSLEDICHIM